MVSVKGVAHAEGVRQQPSADAEELRLAHVVVVARGGEQQQEADHMEADDHGDHPPHARPLLVLAIPSPPSGER